jgi:hypothetical protein
VWFPARADAEAAPVQGFDHDNPIGSEIEISARKGGMQITRSVFTL